jgi:hypothetical protein
MIRHSIISGSLTERETPTSYFKREELRGLFVLGLLAVVASIRIQSKEMTIIISEKSYDVTVFLDIMLILWSFYAFFMVLGFSEDIIGKKSSKMFREISTTYLYLSFVILAFLSVIFFLAIYPTRTPWVLGFLPVLFAYLVIRKLIRIRKTLRPLKVNYKNLLERIRLNLYQILLAIFINCFLLIMYGTSENFIVPSFIVGSVSLVSFLIARDKVEGKKEEKSKSKP